MPHPTKQTGSAIVVALFVVALVAIAATAMLTRIQQDNRRAELQLNSNQAYFYAQGSIAWAMDQLVNDWKNQQPQHVIDKTPITSPLKKMDRASIESTIYDAQGFLNLNNLTDTTYRDNFSRLIKTVMPKMENDAIQNITLAAMSWVTAGGTNNAFDDYYGKQNPSYHAPHRVMTSASELRLVKGMTAELYNKLSPYIIALPTVTPINVNNASVPVLITLGPTLTLESAKAIAALSKQTPFANVQNFLNIDVVKNNAIMENKITVASTFFLVKTTVTIGDQSTILYTLLQREVKNSLPIVTILWQSKGTL